MSRLVPRRCCATCGNVHPGLLDDGGRAWLWRRYPHRAGPFCSARCIDLFPEAQVRKLFHPDTVALWRSMQVWYREHAQTIPARELNDIQLDLYNKGLIPLEQLELVNPQVEGNRT